MLIKHEGIANKRKKREMITIEAGNKEKEMILDMEQEKEISRLEDEKRGGACNVGESHEATTATPSHKAVLVLNKVWNIQPACGWPG